MVLFKLETKTNSIPFNQELKLIAHEEGRLQTT